MDTPIIPDHEIELTAVRSQGAGGQNVKILWSIYLLVEVRALPTSLCR